MTLPYIFRTHPAGAIPAQQLDDNFSVVASPTATGSTTSRTLADRFADAVNVKDYGAKGDGVTDDAVALEAAMAAGVTSGPMVWLPAGTYAISRALAAVSANNFRMLGEGFLSNILYTGASTTPGDLLTFGNGSIHQNLYLGGFTVGSVNALTSGAGVRIKKYVGVDHDISVNGRIGDGSHLWDGSWFDGCSNVDLHNSDFSCLNRGVVWSGGSEFHCNRARVSGTGGTSVGIHVGGGTGGFYTEMMEQLANDIGLKVDTSITGTGNNQFFLNGGTFDGNTTAGAYFNDAVSNPIGKSIKIDGWCASSSAGDGLKITNFNGGSLNSGSTQFRANSGHGLVLNDPSMRVRLGGGTEIYDNGGYGVSAGTAMTIYSDAWGNNNTNGDYTANIIRRCGGAQLIRLFLSVANGASAALPAVSGEFTIANPYDGQAATYIAGGGYVALAATGGGTWVAPTAAPGAGKASVEWDGGASLYKLYNNFGSTQVFQVTIKVVKESA